MAEETKITKLMKPNEVNAAVLGRLMVVSAITESQAFQSGSQVQQEPHSKLIETLIDLYSHEFARESIQAVLFRLLANTQALPAVTKALDVILASLIKDDSRQFALKSCDNLSLVLGLR